MEARRNNLSREALLSKASRNLVWAAEDIDRLDTSCGLGDKSACEKSISNFLTQIAAAKDAIVKLACEVDKAHIKGKIDSDVDNDPLVRYVEHARHLDFHHFAQWDFGAAALELGKVDAEKVIEATKRFPGVDPALVVQMLVFGAESKEDLWRKIGTFTRPDFDKAKESGVEVKSFKASIKLHAFSYVNDKDRKPYKIDAPTKHRNLSCSDNAEVVMVIAAQYYLRWLNRILVVMGEPKLKLQFRVGYKGLLLRFEEPL